MELIAQTEFKKMAPKSGFCHIYIKFPNGYGKQLIGKTVSIYRTGKEFLLLTDMDSNFNKGELNPTNSEIISINHSEEKTQESGLIRNNKPYIGHDILQRSAFHADDWGSNPHSSILVLRGLILLKY